jgi:H+-transporting ATPase
MNEENGKKIVETSPESLGVDPVRGLSAAEALARRATFGFNEVPEKKDPAILRFGRRFWGLTAWMLEITMIISLLLHRDFDFTIIAALLVVNALIGFSQEQRATAAVEALRRRLHVYARVVRDGVWGSVPARELVPGDITRVRAGDFVPADMTILEGSISVDQSALTGESLTLERERGGTLYSGSTVARGEVTALVAATGGKTYFGRTTELLERARPKLHMEEITTRVVTWLLVVVLALIAVIFSASYLRGEHPMELVPLALLLIVFAVPVALPAMFTISMAVGSLELAKQGVLVTRLSASEDAATMDTLCADKTGTITANRLSVVRISPMGNCDEKRVVLYGALASEEANQDPIDLAFLAAARARDISMAEYTQKRFVPFDPATRRTEAVVAHEMQEITVTKGAVDAIASLCHLDISNDPALQSAIGEFAGKGYRTLAVAASSSDAGPELCGLVALYDAPRADSSELIRELHDMGISVKMLTGDALPIAREIAGEVGLEGSVVHVPDLKAELARDRSAAFARMEKSAGFAGIYPEDKYTIVRSLQEGGHVVGMTGDGVNDAPALRQAEVGIAVMNSTDVAKSAASAVLTGEGLSNIVNLVKTGRIIYQRIFTWTLNKIIKTFEVAIFIGAAYLVTGYHVASALDIVMLLFLVDFVTISLSTDNVRWSKNPDKWDVPGLVRVAAPLGVLTIAELFGLLFIGLKYFGLAGDPGAMHTFFLASIFYLGMFTVLIVRERGHFWGSAPSKTLALAIALDMLVMAAIALIGLPGISPIEPSMLAVLFVYTMAASLVVNDAAKVFIIKRSGVR